MAETKMQLVDWLDDLCVRFIINLPHEELTSVERICFQIEEAQWFYEDFVRVQDPAMPQMNLKKFCSLIFQHCPLLAPFSASAALSYAEFLAYKTRVPVRGAIMLNDDMSECVLVKGWNKKAKWSFPRGKINKEERDLDCAVREVYEETGYDIRGAGLVSEHEDNIKYIEMSLREQQMRLYVFRGVPKDTHFEPKTRKEISKIEWYKVSDLASSGQSRHMHQHGQVPDDATLKSSQFYMVAPFIRPLKNWIKQQRKLDQQQGYQKHSIKVSTGETDVEDALRGPVYDDGPTTTDAEDDGHFQRLLSGLQGAQNVMPETIDLPEVTAPASTVDLSAQLKQILSIGGQQPIGKPGEPNSLMSLLRGNQQTSIPPPQTPLEQIVATPPQANVPHHHHPRPPSFPQVAPPPQFPFSPTQTRQDMLSQMHGPPIHWQQPLYQQTTFPGVVPNAMPIPRHTQPHGQIPYPQNRGVFGTHIPPPPPPHLPQPLQTRNPQLQPPQFPQYNNAQNPIPVPPSASQLPQPRFRDPNHAMNLLNVFKSPNVPTAQPAAHKNHTLSQLPELDNRKPSPPAQMQTHSPPPIHQPQAQKARNPHQNALLNLFKGPAPATSPQTRALPVPASEPVELSAQPSPQISRELAKPVQHKLSMRRLPNLNTAASPRAEATAPHLTSATVSGPLNAPDFETVKKNQPARPVELGNGVVSPSPDTLNRSALVPTTVLGRPSSGFQRQTATPPVPVHTVTNRTAMEAPRPFHPTSILRRSAQDISDMAKAEQNKNTAQQPAPVIHNPQPMPRQAQLPNFDRRENAGQEQKKALLDLFGGPAITKVQSPAEFPGSVPVSARPASGIASPVSPLPTHVNLARRQDTDVSHLSRDTPRSSRISSITSVPGDGQFTPAPTSAPIKKVSEGIGSGAQSPVEKNFLLGYLQGVVSKEGAGRGKAGMR